MRLTNSSYQFILQGVVSQAFDSREKARLRREKAAADEIYGFLVPKKVEKAVLELKGGWYTLTDNLDVHTLASRYIRLRLSKVRPLPNVYLNIQDQAMADKAVTIDKERDQLASERAKFQGETERFLRQFTTLKQLRNNWPEGEQFYGALETETPGPGTGLMISPAFISLALEEGADRVEA